MGRNGLSDVASEVVGQLRTWKSDFSGLHKEKQGIDWPFYGNSSWDVTNNMGYCLKMGDGAPHSHWKSGSIRIMMMALSG